MLHVESLYVPAFSDTKRLLTGNCNVNDHRHAEIANVTIATSLPMVRPLLDCRHGPTAILDHVVHVWQEPGGQVVPPMPMTAKWVWFKVNPAARHGVVVVHARNIHLNHPSLTVWVDPPPYAVFEQETPPMSRISCWPTVVPDARHAHWKRLCQVHGKRAGPVNQRSGSHQASC